MPTKADEYREELRALPQQEWEPYLLEHSGLPGPRGNLELAAVVAELGNAEYFEGLRGSNGPTVAPTGDPHEFLAFCGVLGLGYDPGETRSGRQRAVSALAAFACDPRWRIREAVAMAMQRMGRTDVDVFEEGVREWAASDEPLRRRAAVAAVADPPLLRDPAVARVALDVLEAVTTSLLDEADRRVDDVRTMRQALGYAWSVVIVATPEEGKKAFERWSRFDDPDTRWVVRENLKKNRLAKMDPAWVESMKQRLAT